MKLYIHICIIISCAVLAHIFLDINQFVWKSSISSDPLLLAIGILSARENFDLRTAARLTWINQYLPHKNDAVKAWFIIGKDDCHVPPEYRLSKYGCNKWNISTSGLTGNFYTSYKLQSDACPPSSRKVFMQGFSFKVNHPLIVKKLGVLFDLLVPNIETKVALLNIQNKEIVVQTNITINSSHLENGYLYEDVETILLPKHYEGMVLVEGYLQYDSCANVLWNDGGGVITFNRIYSVPSHIDSIKFSNELYSAASIHFDIHDLNGLKSLVLEEDGITSKWLSNLEILNKKLLTESTENQDILFVDVTDIYRYLPIKLLHFYKWIDQNYEFSYVMKSDDDTIVDISQIIKHMSNDASFKADGQWIWSWFRKDWPVNYIGKWADYDYRSSFYPYFPCGATYVMSHKIVQWLSLNANYFFPYQGEDVSMGIWLSALKPDFIDDDRFECDFTCNKKSYNRAQLTADQVYEIWSLYERCQNLCSCD